MSNPQSEIRNSTLKRIITFILALVLLVLLARLAWKLHELSRTPPQPPPAIAPLSPEQTFDETVPGGLDLSRILTDPAAARQALPGGSQSLDHEPADLPVPPQSDILLRYQIGDATHRDEICVRTITDTTLESAASFYRKALTAAHWPFDEKIPAPQVLRLTSEQGGRSLMIRLRQAGSQVRLVIQLRYTMSSDS